MPDDLRIVTWNMGNNSVRASLHERAWAHLLDKDGLNADVALVQEAAPPAWVADSHDVLWTQAWPSRRWGTGIVVRAPQRLEAIERQVEGGRFVAGRLATDGGGVVIVSVHARTDLPEFMPPLVASFDAIRDLCAETRFVVGGDFNSARRAEEFWPGYGHAEFWRTLDDAGFHSCYREQHGEEAITYTHPRGPFVGQADHILVDAGTARQTQIDSWVDESHPELSDHHPLVVDVAAIRP